MRCKRLSVLQRALAIAIFTVGWSLLMASTGAAQDIIHVAKHGSPDPDGSQAKPYQTVEAGIARILTSLDRTVEIEAGTYYETLTLTTPSVVKAVGGIVTIGNLDYQAATSLEIITLNTHLAGDEVFFPDKWKDYAVQTISRIFLADSAYHPMSSLFKRYGMKICFSVVTVRTEFVHARDICTVITGKKKALLLTQGLRS